MTKTEIINKLKDVKFLDEPLFEQPIDLDRIRIVQYDIDPESLDREETASMSIRELLDDESDESLWNPNGDDLEDLLWD